jgi:hypothetical protein
VLACGSSAVLGRGGDPAVAWWLAPAPYDVEQHKRLSRRHAVLSLDAGRAWLTDQSSSGTWLTQPGARARSRVAKGEPELLAAGDEIEPAGVAPLRVGLAADGRCVHGLWLERSDALAGKLSYLLAGGTAPVPLRLTEREPPVAWLAWLPGDTGPELAIHPAGGAGWARPQPGVEETLRSARLLWRPLEAPLEQQCYLTP